MGTESWKLRPARAVDLPTILRLLGRRALPTEGVSEHLESFLVAEAGPSLLGCIGLEQYDRVGLLRSLAVEELAAGQGVGTALVRALIARASQLRLRALYLLTTTADSYFPRFGFSVITGAELPAALEESAELRGACPATAVAMRLWLDVAPG